MPNPLLPNLRHPSFSKLPLLPLGISFGSGILMALATAPLNAYPLAWVALAPLWVLAFSSDSAPHTPHPALYTPHPAPHTPLLLALLWGIGYHGLALSWITGLHPLTWLGMSWWASVAIALFCWAFITLWGAILVVIWVWGVRRLAGRGRGEGETRGRGEEESLELRVESSELRVESSESGSLTQNSKLKTQNSFPRILIATALWCGLEWFWSLGSLYWTSLSYTQSPGNLAILHLGRLSGPAVVTAAIVAINGLLAEAWLSKAYGALQKRDQSEGLTKLKTQNSKLKTQNSKLLTQNSAPLLLSAILLLLSLHLGGYWLYCQPLVQPDETALKVGIIQGNVPTRIKLSAVGVQRAITSYVNGYELLADQGVNAVLTPEGALPVLWDEPNKQQNLFYQAVVRRGVVAWLGTFTTENGRISQSLLSLTGKGETVGRYSKIKLVPLGEYVPFRQVLGGLINRLSPIEADMVPGTGAQRFETPFGRAIASICYESAFPQLFRAQAADGGQFILTASNLDPYSEVLMAQHQAQDLMRAVESDRWAVRATNTGYSGIIDPHGRIVWRSQPKVYEIHAETIYRRQSQTLYVRWGDWLTPLLVILAAVSWVFLSNHERNGSSRLR